jgi:hypothetical protein
MKRLLFPSAICATLLAFGAPVSASQLIPSIFASAFCTAMESGVGQEDAIRFAVRMSLDTTKPPAQRVGNTDLDVRASVYAAQIKCPQYFNGGWQ